MKVIDRIQVVTPVERVASAFELLLAEHGYACRTEPTINGLRLIVSDGRLAVDLVQKRKRS